MTKPSRWLAVPVIHYKYDAISLRTTCALTLKLELELEHVHPVPGQAVHPSLMVSYFNRSHSRPALRLPLRPSTRLPLTASAHSLAPQGRSRRASCAVGWSRGALLAACHHEPPSSVLRSVAATVSAAVPALVACSGSACLLHRPHGWKSTGAKRWVATRSEHTHTWCGHRSRHRDHRGGRSDTCTPCDRDERQWS